MSRTRTYRIAADLLATLEAEGYPLGTGAHLRVQELMRGLPQDANDETLCAALCAVLARNPQEQALVYERFKESAARSDALLEHLKTADEKTAELAETELQLRRWRWRALIPAAVLLLAALAAAWFFWKEKTAPQVIEKLMMVQSGERKMMCASDIEGLKSYGMVGSAQINYPANIADLLPRDRFKTGSTALGSFSLDADSCFIYAARDSIEGLDSIAVQFVFTSGKNATVAFKVLVEKPESEVIVPPKLQGRDTLFRPKNIPYPHDITECAIQPPPVWQSFLADNLWWLRWAFFVPFTLFLFALWRWLEFRRRKLIAQLERRDQPPYFWNIRIPGAEEIVLGDSFAFALQVMRRRAASDVMRLDLSKTIEKTAERGGMPDFRYRQMTRPVDYLLLIERGDPANHRAQLFDALYRAFRAQEIEIARFWYDGDVRLCFDEQNPKGVSLPELANRFAGARLLVLGNGAQFLSPDSGKPAPWTDTFQTWKERALLTPKPTGDWGLDERRLATLFTLLPATLQGLGFWVDELDVGQDAHFEDWQKHVKDAPQSVFQPEADDPLPALMLQFDPQMLRWVAACAIYPSLHWDLTLWLGGQLFAFAEASAGEATGGKRPAMDTSQTPEKTTLSPPLEGSGEAFVTVENLLKLFRVSWFVNGEIPTSARAALLDWLERKDPALLTRLRAGLAELLRQNPPPENSAAYDDYALNIALNEWLATQDPARKKELEADIAKRLEAGARPDFTVLKYLDRPRSPLDFVVPDAWKKYVYPGGYKALGWKGRWKDLLWTLPVWLVVAVGVFWPYQLKVEECTGAKAEIVENGTNLTLCLNNLRCRDMYREYLTSNVVRLASIPTIDEYIVRFKFYFGLPLPDLNDNDSIGLFVGAGVLPARDTTTGLPGLDITEARANIAAELYNRALSYAATQKDSACILFRLAAQLDSLDYDYRRALAWCGDTDKDTIPEIKGSFRLSGYPEAGKPAEFVLIETTAGATYELDPGDGSRKTFSNGRLSYTYERYGSYQVTLYGRYAGQVTRLQTIKVLVAVERKSSDISPIIDEEPSKPGDTTAKIAPPVVTVPAAGGAADTLRGLPPGRYILTGSPDHTAKLWTLEGQEIRTFTHPKNIYDVAPSPDGKRLATASGDNTVKIWDIASGKLLMSLESHSGEVLSAAFSPDGKRLATGSADKTAKIWDLTSGKVLFTLEGHSGTVFSVDFSPDGSQLATASDDKTAKLWDSRNGEIITTLRGHTSSVFSVVFSPDGRRVATGSYDNTVKVWNLEKGGQIDIDLRLDNWALGVAFSPDGKRLAAGSSDGTIKIWDWENKQLLVNIEHEADKIVESVAFSPDGRYLLSGGKDNTAKLWTSDGKLVHTYNGHTDTVWSVAFLWVQ